MVEGQQVKRVDEQLGLPVETYHHDHVCPHCKKVQNLASNVAGGQTEGPQDGDYSFCVACQGWGVFDKAQEGGLRIPSPEETQEISQSPVFRRIEAATSMLAAFKRGNA